MQVYKFQTKISRKGIIKLPAKSEWFNKDVEVIILLKQADQKEVDKNAGTEFVNKWAGSLSNINEDDKYQYLVKKHK